MTGATTPPPPLDELKRQAKRLRASLEAAGQTVGHGRALELIAHQHGYRDWNTLHAAIGNRPPPPPLSVGQQVRGRYLGKGFTGEIVGLRQLGEDGRYRVALRFEDPVNVSAFESMTILRRQITAVVDRRGVTAEKTSDGVPHLRLEL
ncbi:MAG: hypothetical protein TEF_15075 [Rhizobiales bacterium NRL2]|jgi:hypothetical protein|nr:MAG: hypothetical protein TEF_15075 [Rhizobiales bacterium NRL2]